MNKYHPALSWMYIWGWITLSNVPNKEGIWIIPIIMVIFGQNVGFWPPGISMYRNTPHCYAILNDYHHPPTIMQLILNEYHHALSWMYICGWITLSNGRNKEVIWIIPIFMVIFGQNVGFWPSGSLCIGIPPLLCN